MSSQMSDTGHRIKDVASSRRHLTSHIRFWSLAGMAASNLDVRFTRRVPPDQGEHDKKSYNVGHHNVPAVAKPHDQPTLPLDIGSTKPHQQTNRTRSLSRQILLCKRDGPNHSHLA